MENRTNSGKYFCIMPWIHTHILPNGNVMPCCVTQVHKGPMGNVNSESLEQVWNGEKYKQMRLKLLRGEEVESCRVCYENEELSLFSLRRRINRDFRAHFPRVGQTKEDGSLEGLDLAYVDIRFSNLCNLSCKMCCPELSSSVDRDHSKIFGTGGYNGPTSISDGYNVLKSLEGSLESVEEVYFAGGEPLLMEEHLQLLKMLAIKNTKVRLIYNTNMTRLNLGKWNITELWKKFDSVEVWASIDATGQGLEYIRQGTKWETVVSNLKKLKCESPNVRIVHTPTWGLMNGFEVTRAHRYLIENEFISPEAIQITPLYLPHYYSMRVLTKGYKEEIESEIVDHIKYLDTHNIPEYVKQSFINIIHFMNGSDDSRLLPELERTTRKFDGFYGNSFKEAFPEYNNLF